jgi:phage-related tail protein
MVLNKVMSFKTKVMGDIVTKTNTEINKTKLEQSAVGRKLLRDMQKYKKVYDQYQRTEKKRNQLMGMYEDVNFKSQSANISYYIWFILAISGMFLVIKKLKTSN